MDGKVTMFDDSSFLCGDKCRFETNGLIYMITSNITIGNEFTVESGYTFHGAGQIMLKV